MRYSKFVGTDLYIYKYIIENVFFLTKTYVVGTQKNHINESSLENRKFKSMG